MKNALIYLMLWVAQTAYGSQNRKVMLIGIDGCRSDALQQANTPNIDGLLSNSLYSFNSWHIGLTWSGPSWSTVLTGVEWNKHGVTNNSFSGSNFNQYAPFPKLAKELKPNLKCVEVVEWDPLADDFYNDGWDKKIKVADGSTFPTADSAVTQLQYPDIDLLFVYFDKVDLTGHASTFSPSNSLYISAIEDVDEAVGTVLNALYARPDYASEDWLILLITDHGGNGFFHGGNSLVERHIWWTASGDAVPHQQINQADPGTYNCNNNNVFDTSCVNHSLLKQSPVQQDIAVTALHHLIFDSGVNPESKTEWNLDGKSWLALPTVIAEGAENNLIQIFPNPASGSISVVHGQQKLSRVTLSDLLGQTTVEVKEVELANKTNIPLDGVANGTYFLSIQTEENIISKKIIVLQ